MASTLPPHDVDAIARGRHADPFAVLGPHDVGAKSARGLALRMFRPEAVSAAVLRRSDGALISMERVHPGGLFEAIVPSASRDEFDYRYRLTWPDGSTSDVDDPYRYGPLLTDFDLHLLGQGTHHRVADTLGARVTSRFIRPGVHFAVWAPNALRVSVVGDFNGWDGRVHPMRAITPAGYWEIFLPDLAAGACYKFEVVGAHGEVVLKADPCGRYFETPPRTAFVSARPRACISPSGRPTPTASASSAISTAGTAACIRCGC